MPHSVPNTSGSAAPTAVPYGNWESFPTEKYKQPWGDRKSIIYNAADGKVLAGTIYASGKGTYTWPSDEFIYVSRGWIRWEIHGGEPFTLKEGDMTYIKEGTAATYEMSEDYANVVVFISNKPVQID